MPGSAGAGSTAGSAEGATAGSPRAPSSPAAAPTGAPGQPAGTAAASQGASAPKGSVDAILARAEKEYAATRSMEASFRQTLTVPLLGSDQQSRGKMYHRRPDRFLMRFTDPAGDVLVADGRHFWMYYPSTNPKQVIRTSMGEGRGEIDLQREFLSRPTERYVATLVGEESVGGRPAHVISLVPKGRSPYRIIKIWVDKNDSLVRRFEMTEENDSVRRLELSDVRRNADIADSVFRFEPPAGVEIFDQ